MKTPCLMLVLLVLAAVNLRAQVNISVGAANDVSNPGLAGKQAVNPDPGGIPNGSLIDDLSAIGGGRTQFIFTPPVGPTSSVTITGFTGFTLFGLSIDTGLTPVGAFSDGLTASQQTGLTAGGGPEITDAIMRFGNSLGTDTGIPPVKHTDIFNTHNVGILFLDMPENYKGSDNPMYGHYQSYGGEYLGGRIHQVSGLELLTAMFTGSTADAPSWWFGVPNSQTGSNPLPGANSNQPPTTTPPQAVNQTDGNAATQESTPSVVPVVGDLGGPVDEIL